MGGKNDYESKEVAELLFPIYFELTLVSKLTGMSYHDLVSILYRVIEFKRSEVVSEEKSNEC